MESGFVNRLGDKVADVVVLDGQAGEVLIQPEDEAGEVVTGGETGDAINVVVAIVAGVDVEAWGVIEAEKSLGFGAVLHWRAVQQPSQLAEGDGAGEGGA